jgi:hypothetical protein
MQPNAFIMKTISVPRDRSMWPVKMRISPKRQAAQVSGIAAAVHLTPAKAAAAVRPSRSTVRHTTVPITISANVLPLPSM